MLLTVLLPIGNSEVIVVIAPGFDGISAKRRNGSYAV